MNMHEMLKAENDAISVCAAYDLWLAKVCRLHPATEDEAFPLYQDGYTPQEAAAELAAQQGVKP